MPSVLSPNSGNSLPGWQPGPLIWPVQVPNFAEFQANAPWPQNVIQANPRRVLPSFGTSGIPRPTTLAPTIPAASGVATTTQTASGPAPLGSGGVGTGNFFTVSSVKNPAIDTRLANLLGDLDKVRSAGTGDFEAQYRQLAPQFEGLTGQDVGAAGEFFNGAVQSRLDALRESRKKAVRSAADRALGDLTRILSLGNMAEGGGATTGTSSYLQKMGLDKAAEIEAQAALDDAAQARADEDYLNANKLGLLGKRGDLLQSNLTRSLLPSQVNTDFLNKLVTLFAPLLAASNANNFFGLQGPGGYVGDSFGGIQSSRLADLGRIQQGNQFDITSALNALNSDRQFQLNNQQNQLAALFRQLAER